MLCTPSGSCLGGDVSDLIVIDEPQRDTDLLIKFDNKRPIDASEIGLLLRELSADYKRITGGTLALRRFETGSSHLHFTDAVALLATLVGIVGDAAAAVEHMKAFAKHLSGVLKPTQAPQSHTGEVVKGATRIAKIAAEYDCTAEIAYDTTNGGAESLRVTITPSQAWDFQQRTRYKRMSEKDRKLSAATTKQLPPPSAEEIAAQLIDGAPRPSDGRADDVAVLAIISALKSSGAHHLLPAIASALELQGRYDLAVTVRKHIPSGKNTLRLS